jgi:DDE superfamily endonuclease.
MLYWRRVLCIDQFNSHLKNSLKEKLRNWNTELAVILRGLTSQLQSLDVSINKPFKMYVREEWNIWMIDEIHYEFMPKGALKQSTIKQLSCCADIAKLNPMIIFKCKIFWNNVRCCSHTWQGLDERGWYEIMD